MEFGTERGDQAFEEELYAIIGKLKVYDTDAKVALNDMSEAPVDHALNAQVRRANTEAYSQMSGRELASAKVVAFLDMMTGRNVVPIEEPVRIVYGSRQGGDLRAETFEPMRLDGITYYEKYYLASSAIPNRRPDEVPKNAQRVLAERSTGYITVPIDVL